MDYFKAMFPDSLKPVDPLPLDLFEPPTPIVQKGHPQHGSHGRGGGGDPYGSPSGGRSNNSSSMSMGLTPIGGSGLTLGASFRKAQSSPPTKNSSSHLLNMLAENSGSENGSVSGKSTAMSGKSISGEGSLLSMVESGWKGGKKKPRRKESYILDDLEFGGGFVLDEEDVNLALAEREGKCRCMHPR